MVSDVNDAPTVDQGDFELASGEQSEDDQTPPTYSVATLLEASNANGQDDDQDTLGIAVVGVDANDNGTWEYSRDGGNNWDTLNSTSPTQARLLDQNDLVRYRGDGKNGETADLTFRAWDRPAAPRARPRCNRTNRRNQSIFSQHSHRPDSGVGCE